MQHMIHYMPSDLSTVSLSLLIQTNAYINPFANSIKLHHMRLKIYSRESVSLIHLKQFGWPSLV